MAPEECPAEHLYNMGRAACAMRENLAKFGWGTRCARCTGHETPLLVTESTAPALEVENAPVLSPSSFVLQLCSRLKKAKGVTELLGKAAFETPAVCRGFIHALRTVIRWQLRDCVGGGGLVPFGREAPRCWVLSMATPLVDVGATIIPGRILTCPEGEYSEVRAGDAVFFWGDAFFPEKVLPCEYSQRPPFAVGADTAGFVGFGRVLQGPRLVQEFGIVRRPSEGSGKEGEHSIVNRITVRVDTRYTRPLGVEALAKNPALNQKQLSSVPGLRIIPLCDNQATNLQAILSKSGVTPRSRRGSSIISGSEYTQELRESAIQLISELIDHSGDAQQQQEAQRQNISQAQFPALKWLVETGRLTVCRERVRVLPPCATLNELLAMLKHERALTECSKLAPGCCVYCGTECKPAEGCACLGHCGRVVHTACLPFVAPALDPKAEMVWRCTDCADPGTNTHACLGCRGARTHRDKDLVTCDACCGWYHSECARTHIPVWNARLWLCQRCLISPIQAARCELHLLSTELAHFTLSILRRLKTFPELEGEMSLSDYEKLHDTIIDAVKTQIPDATRATVEFYSDINAKVCCVLSFHFLPRSLPMCSPPPLLVQRIEEESCTRKFYTRDVTQRSKRSSTTTTKTTSASPKTAPRRRSAPPSPKHVRYD